VDDKAAKDVDTSKWEVESDIYPAPRAILKLLIVKEFWRLEAGHYHRAPRELHRYGDIHTALFHRAIFAPA